MSDESTLMWEFWLQIWDIKLFHMHWSSLSNSYDKDYKSPGTPPANTFTAHLGLSEEIAASLQKTKRE